MNLARPKSTGRFSPAALFRPDSVAVIGAGTRLGAEVMHNLRDGGFTGAILPVDPILRAVLGVLAYPTVADLPVVPDLAVIADPDSVATALPALAAKGCFAAIVLADVVALSAADRMPIAAVRPEADALPQAEGRPAAQAISEAESPADADGLAGAPATAKPEVPANPEMLAKPEAFSGPEGLAGLARRTGVRVLGPGSFGLIVPALGLNASRAHLTPAKGRLALISQSTALCRAVLDWAGPNGVGFSHVVGIGGNADLGFAAALDWVARDPGTGAILLDVRRIKNRRAFLSAARAASRLRPVVAIRAGSLTQDPSGTTELAFEAALRRAGVLCVSRFEDLLTAAETLSRARPARGEALAIVSNAISAGHMAADAVLRHGLQLATLSPKTEAVLRMRLPTLAKPAATNPSPPTAILSAPPEATLSAPPTATLSAPPTATLSAPPAATNPTSPTTTTPPQFDTTEEPNLTAGMVYVGPDAPLLLAEVAALLAGAAEVGGILVVHTPTGAADAAAIEALAACSATVKLPLLVAAMGETTGAPHRHRLAEAGMAAFATPEQAVRGFLHLVQDRRNRAAAREVPLSRVVSVAADQSDVRRLFQHVRASNAHAPPSPPTLGPHASDPHTPDTPASGRRDMAQDEAMDVLAAYGVPTVPCRAVSTEPDAVTAAALLGYPVVVKLRDTTAPPHRARGGLALDLHDAAEVRLAARTLTLRQKRRTPAAPVTLLVQRQAARGRELLIRVADDPVFGPTIAFGQGGTAAQVQHDIAMDLPPLNLNLAHALIARTRAAGMLSAFRDMPAARIDTVAETLVRVSQLIVDFPEIAALEVNPLFVDAQGVLAADAWLQLRPTGELGTLAIPPYPVDLVEHFEARGERLIIRPIRPEDAAQHAIFFQRLSAEDIRYRFFTAMRELSPEMTARLTQIDYDREMAFVAIREATGDTVGVARLVVEPDGLTGEFAVIVQPDIKGKGLAGRLMHRLTDWARSRGMHAVVGQVLADNAPMLGFMRHLGFSLHRLPEEPDVMEARLSLT